MSAQEHSSRYSSSLNSLDDVKDVKSHSRSIEYEDDAESETDAGLEATPKKQISGSQGTLVSYDSEAAPAPSLPRPAPNIPPLSALPSSRSVTAAVPPPIPDFSPDVTLTKAAGRTTMLREASTAATFSPTVATAAPAPHTLPTSSWVHPTQPVPQLPAASPSSMLSQVSYPTASHPISSLPSASFPIGSPNPSAAALHSTPSHLSAVSSTAVAPTSAAAAAFSSPPQPHGVGMSMHDLSVVVQQNIEFGKAAERIAELQRQNSGLALQLADATAARDRAEAALVEMAAQHAAVEQRIRDSFEVRLADKQKELVATRLRLAALEAQGPKARLLGASASGTGGGDSLDAAVVKLTGPELAALRRDVSEQETLIRGYQQENEQAMRTIKELEDRLQQVEVAAVEETSRVERQMLSAHDDSRARNAETAGKLRRILELERQLDDQRDAGLTRERELRNQIEQLRSQKRELEARKGGVDLRQMQDGDVLVRQVKAEMDNMRATHNAMVAELQGKLKWYAENQEILGRNDELVRGQQETLAALQERLKQYEGPNGQARGTLKRVRELEGQLTALQAALRGRAPVGGSVAAVLAAAERGGQEEGTVALAGKIAALQEQLAKKDEAHEAALRGHQQQLERLKAQVAERVTSDAAGKRGEAGFVGINRRGRQQELERQMDEQRSLYGKRIRELEQKLRDATRAAAAAGGATVVGVSPAKGGAANRRDDALPHVAQLKLREADVRRLQTELDRKTKQLAELHIRLAEAEAAILHLGQDLRRSVTERDQNNNSSGAAAAAGAARLPSPLPSASPSRLPYYDPTSPTQHAFQGPRQGQQQYGGGGATTAHGGQGHHHTVSHFPATPMQQPQQPPAEGIRGGRGTLDEEERATAAAYRAALQEAAALRQEVAALRAQLGDSEQQRRQLAAAVTAVQASQSGDSAASNAEVQLLRRRLEAAEMAMNTVQRAHTEAVERGAQQAAEHQRVLLRMHDEVAHREATRWQDRITLMEQSLRAAEARIASLTAELSEARSRQSWTPEAHAFDALERKMDDMAREQAAREERWRSVLDDTKAMYAAQTDVARRKWEMALEAKDGEVDLFRTELDALLSSARRMRASQAT